MDGWDAGLLPIAFVAMMVHVTGVPLVRPVTTMGDVALELLWLPQVAVYAVIALPPLLADAAKATDTCVSPAVAAPIVGAPGTLAVVLVKIAEAPPMVTVVFTTVLATAADTWRAHTDWPRVSGPELDVNATTSQLQDAVELMQY